MYGMKCTYCKSENVISHGSVVKVGYKQPRFKCQNCGHTFYKKELISQ